MNSQADVFMMQLENQLKKIEKEYSEERKKSKSLRKSLEVIAEKTCNFKYAAKQLGGPNQIFKMSDSQLREFIISNILEQKSEFMNSLKEVQQLYLQTHEEKMNLASRVLELESNKESLSEKSILNMQKNDVEKSSLETSENPVNSQEFSQRKENTFIMGQKVFDIEAEMQKLTTYQEEIIKVMGEFGYSETRQIYNEVMKRMNVKETTLKNQMTELITNMIIETEGVASFLRRNLDLYALTPVGQEIYLHLTDKKAIKAEKDRLKTQHSTLEHAYLIKDTATILEDLGYTHISFDSKANQIQVAGGNRYVPDIIADFSDTAKTYWEVELAHHTDPDFFEKLQKAAKVTNTVYVIAPNRQAFDKLKKQIGRYQAYVLSKNLKTKMTIFVGTINQLKKRELFSNNDCKIKIG